MIQFNHDLDKIFETCGLSKGDVVAFKSVLADSIFNYMDNESKVVEIIETRIKENPVLMRAAVFTIVCDARDKLKEFIISNAEALGIKVANVAQPDEETLN